MKYTTEVMPSPYLPCLSPPKLRWPVTSTLNTPTGECNCNGGVLPFRPASHIYLLTLPLRPCAILAAVPPYNCHLTIGRVARLPLKGQSALPPMMTSKSGPLPSLLRFMAQLKPSYIKSVTKKRRGREWWQSYDNS